MPTKKNAGGQLEQVSCFDNLHYQKSEEWFSVPAWANFFLNLGESLSNYDYPNTRFTIALALPCRSYATALIACGIVCGRSQVHLGESDQEYYEKILAIEEGTPLIYRDGNRKKNAIKRENLFYNEKWHIGIQVDEGFKTTIFIAPEHVRLIEVSNKETVALPLQQKGREIPPPSRLAKAVLGDPEVYNFILQSRLDCVLIGPLSLLQEEFKANFAKKQSTEADELGWLADLSRVREFQPPGSAYRSSIFPAASKDNSKLLIEPDPYAYIFDGPYGFIKWRDWCRKSNWIVLLDRTDPNFNYAATLVNQEYLSRSEKVRKIKIPPMPSNVEAMAFPSDL